MSIDLQVKGIGGRAAFMDALVVFCAQTTDVREGRETRLKRGEEGGLWREKAER